MSRSLLPFVAISALLGAAWTPPPGALLAAPAAEVLVTSSPNTDVRVIAQQAAVTARVGGLARRDDTLFARTPLRFGASLRGAEVRIEAAGRVPVKVEATITGGPATGFSGAGRVVRLRRGGEGGDVLAPWAR